MTLKERVIVETYTGVCMVTGDERNEVYKYMAELMGRPVFTHELASKEIQEKLKELSKPDFIKLCENDIEGTIEVKCTEGEKKMLIDGLSNSRQCVFPHVECVIGVTCEKCIEKNIKWCVIGDSEVSN